VGWGWGGWGGGGRVTFPSAGMPHALALFKLSLLNDKQKLLPIGLCYSTPN